MFTEKLLAWFTQHERPMPWKGEKNAYKVWLSEIILQQTRVEQGLPYYLRFTEKYPTITDLANAPEDEVMKLWEGLGYYSRARNLHETAKIIVTQYGGVFPKTHEKILSLKGVGSYTAAAIASFAFDLPYSVLDGNVFRVLSRVFGIATPIDSTEGKKEFSALAQQLLDPTDPARYNQAIMDFGAKHCMPTSPKCGVCPFTKECVAFQEQKINDFPKKSKKIIPKVRYFNYLVVHLPNNQTFIRKRTEKDIWQNLYEFPCVESEKLILEWKNLPFEDKIFFKVEKKSLPITQLLTHRKIIATFWHITSIKNNNTFRDEIHSEIENLRNFAFPKVIDNYMNQWLLVDDY